MFKPFIIVIVLINFLSISGCSILKESNCGSELVVCGNVDPVAIRGTLRSRISDFKQCFSDDIKPNSKVFTLMFSVGQFGGATSSRVESQWASDSRILSCMERVIDETIFPIPIGGGTYDVKQPFNFSPK